MLLILPLAPWPPPQPIELALVLVLCAGRRVYAPGGGLDVRAGVYPSDRRCAGGGGCTVPEPVPSVA